MTNLEIYALIRGKSKSQGGSGVATSTETTASLPLTLTGNGKLIKNYRIYGNTVDGESVGDLITEGEHTDEYHIPINVEGANLFDVSAITIGRYLGTGGNVYQSSISNVSDYIPVTAGTTLTLSWDYLELSTNSPHQMWVYGEGKQGIQMIAYTPKSKIFTFQIPDDIEVKYLRITVNQNFTDIMLNRGATALPYEPYATPVTTDIFVSEPIGMTDGNADYIDYKTQKRYNADGTSESVMLPAIRTISGTNVLLFGTAVQPSKMTLPVETTFQFNEESENVNATLQTAQINRLQSLDNFQINQFEDFSQEDDIMENSEILTTASNKEEFR